MRRLWAVARVGAPGACVTSSPIERLFEASSLCTPEARRLRATVPDETARRIVERSKLAEPSAAAAGQTQQ